VQAAAARGVGDVDVFGGAFHCVPHLPLYGQGARRVVDDEAVAGMPLPQQVLCLLQTLHGIGVQVGFFQVFVQDGSGEVVGTGVHQVDGDAAVRFGDVDETEGVQIAGRTAFDRGRRGGGFFYGVGTCGIPFHCVRALYLPLRRLLPAATVQRAGRRQQQAEEELFHFARHIPVTRGISATRHSRR